MALGAGCQVGLLEVRWAARLISVASLVLWLGNHRDINLDQQMVMSEETLLKWSHKKVLDQLMVGSEMEQLCGRYWHLRWF